MRRAAIGPIGDDIPSIFPIVAGVLLFIGTVLYVAQQLEARNEYLDLRKAGTGLSYAASSKAYVSDADFASDCSVTYKEYAARRRISFLVSLKKFCHYIDLSSSVFSTKTDYGSHNNFHQVNGLALSEYRTDYHHNGLWCASEGVSCNAAGACSPQPPNFQAFNFPVAVDCADPNKKPLRGPGVMNVIVWRGK